MKKSVQVFYSLLLLTLLLLAMHHHVVFPVVGKVAGCYFFIPFFALALAGEKVYFAKSN